MLFKVISLIHSMKQPTLPILKCSPVSDWPFFNCRHFLERLLIHFHGYHFCTEHTQITSPNMMSLLDFQQELLHKQNTWFAITVPTPILLSSKLEKKKIFFLFLQYFLSFLCYKSTKNYSHWKIIYTDYFPHMLNYRLIVYWKGQLLFK